MEFEISGFKGSIFYLKIGGELFMNNDNKYKCESCNKEDDKCVTCCGEKMKENNHKCDCGSGNDKSACCGA